MGEGFDRPVLYVMAITVLWRQHRGPRGVRRSCEGNADRCAGQRILVLDGVRFLGTRCGPTSAQRGGGAPGAAMAEAALDARLQPHQDRRAARRALRLHRIRRTSSAAKAAGSARAGPRRKPGPPWIHPPRAVRTQHPPPICGFLAECLFRLRRAASIHPQRRGPVDPRAYPRQLRLTGSVARAWSAIPVATPGRRE